jgi:hypothetical protein
MNRAEVMQNLWKQYQSEHGYEPSGTKIVVEWAVQRGLLDLPQVDALEILAHQMSKALRQETNVDRFGREYRVNHAVRGSQGTLWGVLGYVRDDHMEKSFTQRREQIIGDCFHLRNDVDVFNDKRIEKGKEPYQLDLNFTEDVEERLAIKV